MLQPIKRKPITPTAAIVPQAPDTLKIGDLSMRKPMAIGPAIEAPSPVIPQTGLLPTMKAISPGINTSSRAGGLVSSDGALSITPPGVAARQATIASATPVAPPSAFDSEMAAYRARQADRVAQTGPATDDVRDATGKDPITDITTGFRPLQPGDIRYLDPSTNRVVETTDVLENVNDRNEQARQAAIGAFNEKYPQRQAMAPQPVDDKLVSLASLAEQRDADWRAKMDSPEAQKAASVAERFKNSAGLAGPRFVSRPSREERLANAAGERQERMLGQQLTSAERVAGSTMASNAAIRASDQANRLEVARATGEGRVQAVKAGLDKPQTANKYNTISPEKKAEAYAAYVALRDNPIKNRWFDGRDQSAEDAYVADLSAAKALITQYGLGEDGQPVEQPTAAMPGQTTAQPGQPKTANEGQKVRGPDGKTYIIKNGKPVLLAA